MNRYYVQCAAYPHWDIVALAQTADAAAVAWLESVGMSEDSLDECLDMLVLPLTPATNLVLPMAGNTH
jgi:hypothetical protein